VAPPPKPPETPKASPKPAARQSRNELSPTRNRTIAIARKPGDSKRPEPPTDLKRLIYPDPRLPPSVRERHRDLASLEGVYLICAEPEGSVRSVRVLRPIEGADEEISQFIESHWLYKPTPTGRCEVRRFIFLLGSGAATGSSAGTE
jgi:hypothetical protein